MLLCLFFPIDIVMAAFKVKMSLNELMCLHPEVIIPFFLVLVLLDKRINDEQQALTRQEFNALSFFEVISKCISLF